METIKERRKKLRLSQEKMAAILDVERSTIAKWESGTMPRTDKIPAIAKVLGFSVEEMFTVLMKGR